MTYTEGNNKIDLLSDVLHVTLSQETWQTDFGAICRTKSNMTLYTCSSRMLHLYIYLNGCLAVKVLSRWQIFSEEFLKLHVIPAFYLRGAECEWTEISSSAQTNTTFNSLMLQTLHRKMPRTYTTKALQEDRARSDSTTVSFCTTDMSLVSNNSKNQSYIRLALGNARYPSKFSNVHKISVNTCDPCLNWLLKKYC